ncbi:MAG: hypothetical protein ACOH5I_22260 [Oligoflexus sp.]
MKAITPLLMLSLISWDLQASENLNVISSPECGNLRSRIVNGSLAIEFDDFSVETNHDFFAAKTCSIRVEQIKVPKGKQFRPVRAYVDGEIFTSECGAGLVELNYSWMDETIEARQEFKENILDGQNFLVETGAADWWAFTECSQEDQYVAMEGSFHIAAESFPNDLFSSSIQLANHEAQSGAYWEWEWQDCPPAPVNPWLGKKFRSRYTNHLNQWLVGYTELEEDTGNYHLDNGNRGIFYDVSYHDEGRTAQGLWRFQNGTTGWFRFIIGLDEDEFEGVWGYGTTIGELTRGRWKGYLTP